MGFLIALLFCYVMFSLIRGIDSIMEDVGLWDEERRDERRQDGQRRKLPSGDYELVNPSHEESMAQGIHELMVMNAQREKQ